MRINSILSPKQMVLRNAVDDAPIGIVVKYVGDEASATVTVSAAGDITFKHGAAGAEAFDSTIDSGGDDPGVIDVSDANANTLGEVVDLINASANWKAFLKDALRADSADASTGSLLARTETTLVPSVTETPLYTDTSKTLNMSLRISSRIYVNGTEVNSAAELYRVISKNTFASGTSKIQIYEVDELAKTETKITEFAGGATTVEQDKNLVQDGIGSVAVSRTGMHMLIRLIGSVACTGALQINGAVSRGA
jgi:hypothetical protein